MPCRAQGRPKTRIIWDRFSSSLSHSSTPQFDELKSHKMSINANVDDLIRFKRSANATNGKVRKRENSQIGTGNIGIDENDIDEIDNNRNDSDDDDNDDDDDDTDDGTIDTISVHSNLPDAIPISFFPTQSTSEHSRLEVTENGELILRDVTKRDEGWYACAALNEAGSIVKRIFIRVINENDNDNSGGTSYDIDQTFNGNRFTNEQNIIIISILALSPNSLDITWETSEGLPDSLLTLHYRIIGTSEFQTAQTQMDKKEFTINDLRAHTEYEIFASAPNGLSGSVSNIRKGKTMDGPPTSPPTDVRVGVINTTAAYVRWSSPPSNMLNGELSGYKVSTKNIKRAK